MSFLTNPTNAEFWIMIALAALFVILWRAKVPGMALKSLDDAGARVQAQLDEAVRLREEAQALLAQIHAQRLETERAAAEMLKNAEADAERMRAEAATKLEEDVKRRAQMAERRIAQAEAQAANDVKAAAADLASQAAEGVFAARMAGTTNDPLIDAGLSNLAARFS